MLFRRGWEVHRGGVHRLWVGDLDVDLSRVRMLLVARMNLQQFIKETLIQIHSGVREANNASTGGEGDDLKRVRLLSWDGYAAAA